MSEDLSEYSSLLNEQLLLAHASDDRESLVALYIQASDAAAAQDDEDASRFYLTQAYVFALDTGSDKCDDLKYRLEAAQKTFPE